MIDIAMMIDIAKRRPSLAANAYAQGVSQQAHPRLPMFIGYVPRLNTGSKGFSQTLRGTEVACTPTTLLMSAVRTASAPTCTNVQRWHLLYNRPCHLLSKLVRPRHAPAHGGSERSTCSAVARAWRELARACFASPSSKAPCAEAAFQVPCAGHASGHPNLSANKPTQADARAAGANGQPTHGRHAHRCEPSDARSAGCGRGLAALPRPSQCRPETCNLNWLKIGSPAHALWCCAQGLGEDACEARLVRAARGVHRAPSRAAGRRTRSLPDSLPSREFSAQKKNLFEHSITAKDVVGRSSLLRRVLCTQRGVEATPKNDRNEGKQEDGSACVRAETDRSAAMEDADAEGDVTVMLGGVEGGGGSSWLAKRNKTSNSKRGGLGLSIIPTEETRAQSFNLSDSGSFRQGLLHISQQGTTVHSARSLAASEPSERGTPALSGGAASPTSCRSTTSAKRTNCCDQV